MHQKIIISMIISIIVLSTFSSGAVSFKNPVETNIDNLSSKQAIIIPIDTSLPEAKFQPIDINVEFEDNCFAKNETIHSVRICYDDGVELNEIESQIYDLEHTDDIHISSCSIVFLIPEKADGKEKYYVLYDSKEVKGPDYPDHIILEDTHYYYEPIPGQKIDFDYYKITEDGYINYLVVQKGELLGNPISLAVAKFKPKSTIAETYNIDQLGVFDMRYGIHEEPGYIGSAWATEVNKNILVDGNLMVRVRIESISPRGDIKSDNIYTYYYCPSKTKSIFVNVNHEVLKTHEIEDPQIYDGIYAGIVSIKSRSATIEKMDVGEILPLISLYSDDESVQEYSMPQNPDSIIEEEIFSTEADIDLGKKAWVCLRDPSTGKVHGLIMDSTTGLVEGEEDGVQVKAFVKQNVKLPGLEADSGNLFLTKNAYDKGREQTTTLTQGFKVNFDIKLITLENDGYEKIDKESEIFQKLIKEFPIQRQDDSGEEEEVKRYSMTTTVHFAPSAPIGSIISAGAGINASYIYAELYKDNIFRSSCSASRISLASIDLDFEGKSFFEKIKTVIGLFDWKNASLFKKIVFPDLEVGRYAVKIYRENPFFAKERQYIGFAIVDVDKDTTARIYCNTQGSISANVLDQNDAGIVNVLFSLEQDGEIVTQTISDSNGNAVLSAPSYPLKPYTLKIFYKGFLVEEKKVKLGLVNRFFDVKEILSFEKFDLTLKVKDTWGFAPAVDINPMLTGSEMTIPTFISDEEITPGKYLFADIIPAEYDLTLSFKSFETKEKIILDQDKTFEAVFPAEYKVNFFVTNSYGQKISEKEIRVIRNQKEIITNVDENGEAFVSVPPGEYELIIKSNENEIAKQKIIVHGEKNVDVLTKEQSILHMIIVILGILLLVISIFLIFYKRRTYNGLKILLIALLIISLFSSWWTLSGDEGSVQTSTNTMLIPQKIVSFTETSNVIGGEISQVPEEVTMVLALLQILVIIGILLLLSSIITRRKLRKTTMSLSILSFVSIFLAIVIFYIAMSQITEIGVGSFIGTGNVDITIPGSTQIETLKCSWGPGIGFILGIIVMIIQIGLFIIGRRKPDLLN